MYVIILPGSSNKIVFPPSLQTPFLLQECRTGMGTHYFLCFVRRHLEGVSEAQFSAGRVTNGIAFSSLQLHPLRMGQIPVASTENELDSLESQGPTALSLTLSC